MLNSFKLLRTSTFRLAAIYLAIFALSVGGLLGYIYLNTSVLLERQTDDTIRAEVQALADQYQLRGLAGIVETVRRRSQEDTGSVYLLTDPNEIRVAGNIDKLPLQARGDDASWIEFPVDMKRGGISESHTVRAFHADLDGDYEIVVGRDIEVLRQFDGLIRRTLFVTLGDRVTIGARVTLYPGVFVGSDSKIGDDSVLYPNVVVREGCSLGARVIVHSGTVIGADGFGYVQHQGRHQKIPQLGSVVIEDDVELGANVTVDRATLGVTRIKQGTKVDNLVQVAHNVTVGEHCILVAQVGIAGSTTIGHHVIIGGQAGLSDHITIGDQVMIAAKAGVNRSVESNQIVGGIPALPRERALKVQGVFHHLPELNQQVRDLADRVERLEQPSRRTPTKARATRKKRVAR